MAKVFENKWLYTLGFLFTEDRKRVLLVQRTKPAWQAGKLNGIGGHVEHGEFPAQAMHRETYEETGLVSIPWEEVAQFSGVGYDNALYKCHVFCAFSDKVVKFEQKEDQPLVILTVEQALALPHIEHLEHLLPFCVGGSSFQGVPCTKYANIVYTKK